MSAAKIKKGDKVVVLAGRDRGKQGEVIRVMPKENRALVRGVNMVRRHTKQSASEQGGIIAKEGPIDLSNLGIEDPKDGKPSRVGFKTLDDGTKVRFAKRSGEIIRDKA
jgi:large subunit ribosomal protein L24